MFWVNCVINNLKFQKCSLVTVKFLLPAQTWELQEGESWGRALIPNCVESGSQRCYKMVSEARTSAANSTLFTHSSSQNLKLLSKLTGGSERIKDHRYWLTPANSALPRNFTLGYLQVKYSRSPSKHCA